MMWVAGVLGQADRTALAVRADLVGGENGHRIPHDRIRDGGRPPTQKNVASLCLAVFRGGEPFAVAVLRVLAIFTFLRRPRRGREVRASGRARGRPTA